MQVQLDDAGKANSKTRTPKLFDPVNDPVTEKAVRAGNSWIFVTFTGMEVPIEAAPVFSGRQKAGRSSMLPIARLRGDPAVCSTSLSTRLRAAVQPDARRRRLHAQGSRN